jgi:uncharacterized protein YkwD
MRKLLRILLAFTILLPALMLKPERTHAQTGDASQLIAEVNSLRAAYGLPAYKVSSALMSAAQKQSNYQAEIGAWTHTGPGGSSPRDRAIAAGYGGGAKVFISENVAAGVNLSTSKAVYEMWQNALHLETMISPYFTHIGAGVGQSGDWVYYTIVVGYLSSSPGSGSNSAVSAPPDAAGVTPAPTIIPVIPITIATPGIDGSIIHEVQSGQFLENIANTYEVSLADLMALNGLTEQSVIYPGEQILIQAGKTPENPQGTAEVEATQETETATPTHSATPTSKPPTRTPTPVPVAMDIPVQASPTASPLLELDEPEQDDAGGSNYLLFAVFGLAISGTAMILLGSFLKKRS